MDTGPGPLARPRILYVLTAAVGLEKTLGGQLRYLKRAGFNPSFVCAEGEQVRRFAEREGVPGEGIALEREVSPLKDLQSLWILWRMMRRLRPRITNVSAPKAGLLGGLAAWLAGVECRIYTLRGLRLETASGLKYLILWASEWLACRFAHRVVCVGRELARRAIELRLIRPEAVLVAGSGSSNGVDIAHFEPGTENTRRAKEALRRLEIPEDSLVVGYVGRLTRDKGIAELVAAFRMLKCRRPSLRLLLVGCFESGDPVAPSVRQAIEGDPHILVTGFVDDPASFYQLMDVVALPTYREGFPNVALEAAAARRPFVTTSATGASEAVQPGETGLIVPPGDSQALAQAIESLLNKPYWAAELAHRAHARVAGEFEQSRVWRVWEGIYQDLLAARARQGWSRGDAVRDGQTSSSVVSGKPAATISRWARSRSKRAIDLIGGLVGVLVFGPVMLFVSAWVLASMGRPVLFRQERSGRGGRRFVIYKLRTMAAGPARVPDEERVTRLGRLLRRWSIDELPQLGNVLRREMSLVGPRPLPVEYESRYNDRQRRRHDVRPGITGWAQVRGRNGSSWEERFEHDLWYVEHASPWVDLQILVRSIVLVVKGSGVSPDSTPLMPEFVGETRDAA